MGTVLAVLSGKGGTGKSTSAAALACALSERGRRVICVDADTELRNLDLVLGLSAAAVTDYGDVLNGSLPAEEALISSPQFPELRLLAAPPLPGTGGPEGLLPELKALADYVVVDYPGGLGRLAGGPLPADRLLVVATADPCSQRDAERVAQLAALHGMPAPRLLINRVSPKLLRVRGATLDDTVDGTGLQLIGVIPEDPDVTLAVAAGRPLLDWSAKRRGAAAAFRRVAARLDGERVPLRL